LHVTSLMISCSIAVIFLLANTYFWWLLVVSKDKRTCMHLIYVCTSEVLHASSYALTCTCILVYHRRVLLMQLLNECLSWFLITSVTCKSPTINRFFKQTKYMNRFDAGSYSTIPENPSIPKAEIWELHRYEYYPR
jgi:hypothetical protein